MIVYCQKWGCIHCYVVVVVTWLFAVGCGGVFIVELLSFHCYISCIIYCRVVKEASHKFREETGELSQAQSGGSGFWEGTRFIWRTICWVGTAWMSRGDVALHYITVVHMRCLTVVEYTCMELCDFECDE